MGLKQWLDWIWNTWSCSNALKRAKWEIWYYDDGTIRRIGRRE